MERHYQPKRYSNSVATSSSTTRIEISFDLRISQSESIWKRRMAIQPRSTTPMPPRRVQSLCRHLATAKLIELANTLFGTGRCTVQKAEEGALRKLFNTFMLQGQDTHFARWSRMADLLLPDSNRWEWQALELSSPACPIFAASSWGFPETLNTLLETSPLDSIRRNKDGETPLYVSCCYGNLEIVQLLLEAVADVNAQGGEDDNALQAASGGGHAPNLQPALDTGVLYP